MHWRNGKWLLAVLVSVYMVGCGACAYLGQDDATWEQQFFEVDQAAIGSLQTVTLTLSTLRERGIIMPDKVKVSVSASAQSLKLARDQTRSWVDACGDPEQVCPPAERLQLGIDNVIAATAVVNSLVREIKGYE